MKHLQRLPKNTGDSILLGTMVAMGIKPDTHEIFASFDANGELMTYLIETPVVASSLFRIFREGILKNSTEFNALTLRNDLKIERMVKAYKLYSIDSPDSFNMLNDG